LLRGRASLAEFEDEVVKDPAVLALASRVRYDLDPTIDFPRQFIGHVCVRLRDGRVVEESQDHPRGGPDAPMSRAEIEGKFRGDASLLMSAGQTARVMRNVDALPTAADLRDLMELLAFAGPLKLYLQETAFGSGRCAPLSQHQGLVL